MVALADVLGKHGALSKASGKQMWMHVRPIQGIWDCRSFHSYLENKHINVPTAQMSGRGQEVGSPKAFQWPAAKLQMRDKPTMGAVMSSSYSDSSRAAYRSCVLSAWAFGPLLVGPKIGEVLVL